MAENTGTEGDTPTEEVSKKNAVDDAVSKPLKMSFADWKKSKEEKVADSEPAKRNGRQPHKNDSKQHSSGNRNHNNNNNNSGGNNNNNNNSYAPLSRPPQMPFPLMSMGFGNFGSSPMMPHAHNMGNMGNMGPGPGSGPGPGQRNHRPLQPPPFWQDMMSPQHRTPPIQPPMPKCPSLWNLVPKDKGKKQSQNQPNKKYKTSNNTSNNSNKSSTDAALMPPPPAPGGSNSSNNSNSNNSSTTNNSNSNSQNGVIKKKKGGTFVQIDGKWIQRPEAPLPLEDAPPGTKEDRQRQWREYRQAMKPFKNREFHNWKRTVQRLSKLPRNTLDERQLERLQKAEEYIGAHKAMLTIKHAEHWVQQNNQKPEAPVQGQVYVRKQAGPTWNRKDNHTTFQQGSVPVRKQTFGTGRAIKGGAGADPSLPITALPPPIGQFPDMSSPPISGGYFGQTYGQESTSSNHSNPFYANYNSSFVKGGTLLPP